MDHITRFVVGFLALLVISYPLAAATTNPFRSAGPVQSTGNFVDVRTTFVTRSSASNDPFFTTRTTSISKASIGAAGRSLLGGPAGIALTAALLAADYLVNGDAVTDPGDPAITEVGTCRRQNSVQSSLTIQQCQQSSIGFDFDEIVEVYKGTFVSQGDTRFGYFAAGHNWSGSAESGGFVWILAGQELPNYPDPAGTPDVDLSDQQLGEFISDNLPDLITGIINSVIAAGTWPTLLPDLNPTRQNIEETLAQDLEGVMTPNYDPTIIVSSNSQEIPDQSGSTGEPPTFDLPEPCDWFNVLCLFIDFMQQETDMTDQPSVPIDEQTLDFNSYDAGLPLTGVCPADLDISLSFLGANTFQFSYMPICDLADQIRPFVIMAAYLLSVMLFVRSFS